MNIPVRITATDSLGNLAYVHRDEGGRFRCTLANGISAAFSYAGIANDEMECRFALDDCSSGQEALGIVRRFGSPNYTYALHHPVGISPTEPMAALSALEAEVQRLKALIPALFEQVDSRAVDRARAVLAGYSADTSLPDDAPKALYLRLHHGRPDPGENLEHRGTEGPVIGPLVSVRTTYLSDIRFAAAPEVMDRFFPDVIAEWRKRRYSNAAGPVCDWELTIVDDLIEYEGVFYGEWSAFLADPAEIAKLSPAGTPLSAATQDVSINETAPDVSERQLSAADAAYERYDFGHPVACADVWWISEPSTFSRTIWLEADHTGRPVDPVTLTVTFAPATDRLVSAIADDGKGNPVGRYPYPPGR